MSSDKSLLIRINGDSQGLKKEFDSIKAETAKLEDNLKSIAKVSTVAFVGLTAAAIGLVAAFRDDEQAIFQTEAVLKSTGYAAGVTSQQVAELSARLQDQTTFTDSAVTAAQNMLLTFTNIGRDVFPQATEATLNLAEKMGTDAAGAAIQLGKALNDPIVGLSALSRVGVKFTEEQKEQIKTLQESGNIMGAQKIILNELEREFGGVAKAAAQGTGVFIQIQNVLGNIFSSIGENIFKTIQPFTTELLKILKTLRDGNPEVFKFASNVILVGTAVAGIITVLATAGLAFLAINTALAVFGVAALPVIVAITAISAAVIYLGSNMEALSALVTAAQAGYEVYYTAVNRAINDLIIGFNKLVIAGKEAGLATLEAFPADLFSERVKSMKANIEELKNANAALRVDNEKTGQSFTEIYDRIDAEQAATRVRDEQAAIAAERILATDAETVRLTEEALARRGFEATQRELVVNTRSDAFAADLAIQELENELKQAVTDKASGVEQLKFQQKIDALKKIRDTGITEEQKQDFNNKDALRKADEEDTKKTAAFRKKGQEDTLNSLQNLNSNLLKEGTAGHRALFTIERLAQIATATIRTASAVTGALATVPFPYNLAAAAAIGAAGAVQVATIVGTIFGAQDGALVGGANNRQGGDRHPYMLQAGELVVPKRNFEEVISATAAQRGYNTGGAGGGGSMRIEIDLTDNAAQFITTRQFENTTLGTDRG